MDRRRVLGALGAGLLGVVAGCPSGPSFPDADVVAGPQGDMVFEPADLTVAAGSTVSWGFASSGHNVSARPGHAEEVVLPERAEPFSSYKSGASSAGTTVRQGRTYEHSFDLRGRYVYVCVPHADWGMVGTIRVE